MNIDRGRVITRPFVPEDAATLADVLRDSIRGLGSAAYSPGQIEAWASYPVDLEEFRARLSGGVTVVAEDGGDLIAFGQLNPLDHVKFLYCRTARARQGVASAVYRILETRARASGLAVMTTDASRVSRPFFEKFGYRIEATEHVEWRGETLERFRMAKDLVGSGQ